MPQKKDNLPINTEPIVKDGGSISYANEVIAIIAGIAASEIDGIAGMVTAGGLGEIISRNRNITRGVKVEVGQEEVSVDLYAIIEYGQPIQKVAAEVQENVRKSIESMTGLHVVRVDIHVQGVSFEKDKKDAQNRLEAANVPHLADPLKDRKVKKTEKIDKTTADDKAPPQPEANKPVGSGEPVSIPRTDGKGLPKNPESTTSDEVPAAAENPQDHASAADPNTQGTHPERQLPGSAEIKQTDDTKAEEHAPRVSRPKTRKS